MDFPSSCPRDHWTATTFERSARLEKERAVHFVEAVRFHTELPIALIWREVVTSAKFTRTSQSDSLPVIANFC